MTVMSSRAVRRDHVRVALVAALGIAQFAVSAAGATGFFGAPVGEIAQTYRTPLLAASWAFAAWFPIYVGFLAYAGYQFFPRQRHRELHRRTGWWLVASAVFNMCWIVAFSAGLLPLAHLMLVGLLVVLAVAFGRGCRERATSTAERLAFRLPVAVYTGWVSMATVMGTAATGVWLGLPGDTAIASVAAVIVLVAVGAVVTWVLLNGTAVAGYAAAVAWASVAIVLNDPPLPVAVVTVGLLVVVLVATVRRIASTADRTRAAFG